MTLFQSIFLGFVQGLSEFAPISSSAHLVLIPRLLNWPLPSIGFDLILHLGTLVAVIVYFKSDLRVLIAALFNILKKRQIGEDSTEKLVLFLFSGTLLTSVIAYIFKSEFEKLFERPFLVASLLLITGILLWLSERIGRQEKALKRMNIIDSLVIGLAQGFAVAPGISRSGATISAGLFRGLSREESARFSFLLSIPIISIAALDRLGEFLRVLNGDGWINYLAGFIASAIAGYLCIKFLLKYLQKRKLDVFAFYCWFLGIGFILVKSFWH
ncbi:MAG: undecaprenyl-diphosphate phosphatase [Actinobacteria bacterium]|nr:undecaprenyl-diphosphate phosphatase [Actinomycetota bacterium]